MNHQESSHNHVENFRAVLFALVVVLAAMWGHSRFEQWYKASPGFVEANWKWLIVGVLLFMGTFSHWLVFLFKTGWSYCKDRWFLPAFTLALVGALWMFGDAGCPWTAFLLAWPFLALCFFGLWSQKEQKQEPVDELNRRYFVNRIAETFCEETPSVHRVALMGTWGTGKTTALELLQFRLQDLSTPKFTIAFVNPWKAKTPQEAWAILAKGVDEALGIASPFPTQWAKHPIFTWLLKKLPFQGVTPELVQFFAGESSEVKKSLVSKINATVGQTKRLVILVDDMERTDPLILKSLFPVIDELSQLKNCFFVFAMDADRVAEAFGEKGLPGPTTKGYLDKVFDLQVHLPPPNQRDVALMIERKVDKSLPKLKAAFPALLELIPTNPRAALRFLADARSKELLFLKRYGHKEKSFVPFFIVCLCEVEFPGFVHAIRQPEAEMAFISLFVAQFNHRGRIKENDNFKALIVVLIKHLDSSVHEDDRLSARLETLVAALATSAGAGAEYLVEATVYDMEWAVAGYMQLRELASAELEKVQKEWAVAAGTKSLEHIVGCAHSDKYTDPSRCAEQLIQSEVATITACIPRGKAAASPTVLSDALERTERLIAHLKYAMDHKSPFDLKPFNEELFGEWLKFIVQWPTKKAMHPLAEMLHQKITQFHLALGDSFEAENVSRRVKWMIRNHYDDYDHGCGEEAKKHRIALERELTRKVTNDVVSKFRSGTIPIDFPPPGNANEGSLQFFYDPSNWLWMKAENWNLPLEELAKEAPTNRVIADACARIIHRLFLDPLARPEQGYQQSLMNVINDVEAIFPDQYPEYVRMLWLTALSVPLESEERRELLQARDRAAKANTDDVWSKRIEAYFPIVHADAPKCPPEVGDDAHSVVPQ